MSKKCMLYVIFLCLFCTALPAFAAQENIITTTGEAVFRVKPDIAKISLRLENQDKDIGTAQKQNAETMQKLINNLVKAGVKKEEIQTMDFNVYPLRSYQERSDNSTIIGYRISQQVLVTTTQLESIDFLTSQALAAGVTNVESLTYGIKNQDTNSLKALNDAVKNAKQKAMTIAKSAGLTIKGIKSIQENSLYVNNPNDYSMRAKQESDGMGMTLPKNVEIRSAVTVQFFF